MASRLFLPVLGLLMFLFACGRPEPVIICLDPVPAEEITLELVVGRTTKADVTDVIGYASSVSTYTSSSQVTWKYDWDKTRFRKENILLHVVATDGDGFTYRYAYFFLENPKDIYLTFDGDILKDFGL